MSVEGRSRITPRIAAERVSNILAGGVIGISCGMAMERLFALGWRNYLSSGLNKSRKILKGAPWAGI
ncbi:MAG TPA: hypothetical protein VF783_07845 [Terriglobales bacterium]